MDLTMMFYIYNLFITKLRKCRTRTRPWKECNHNISINRITDDIDVMVINYSLGHKRLHFVLKPLKPDTDSTACLNCAVHILNSVNHCCLV